MLKRLAFSISEVDMGVQADSWWYISSSNRHLIFTYLQVIDIDPLGPQLHIYRLYHAVEVYTGMYKTAETGLETRAFMHSRIYRHGMV